MNLCNLLERVSGSRLTAILFDQWYARSGNPVEIHEKGTHFSGIDVPKPAESGDMEILRMPIEKLAKSTCYPYGLTNQKIDRLKEAKIDTVGQLANASDEDLLHIESVGEMTLDRFRSVVGQAIWM